MSSSEEYLESLLRAAINGEQNVTDISAIDKKVEPEPENIATESATLMEQDIMEPMEEPKALVESETEESKALVESETEEPKASVESETEESKASVESGMPEMEVRVDTETEEMPDDPNRALGADEIAALFAQAGLNEISEEPEARGLENSALAEELAQEPEVGQGLEIDPETGVELNLETDPEPEVEQKSEREQESIETFTAQETLEEPIEVDLESDDVLDLLLGIREKTDEGSNSEPIEVVGTDWTESGDEEDLDSLLKSLGEENEDLQEIGELFQKLDSNELVIDDPEESALMDSAESEGSKAGQRESTAKKERKTKEKKGFSFFKKKKKAEKEEAIQESAELPEKMPEELSTADLAQELGLEAEEVAELVKEDKKEEGRQKKGLFAKMFDVLTEEIPEDEEKKTEDEGSSETKGKTGKKEKKGKKGKKSPVTDASDNEGILEELDAEESESKKGKKKAGNSKKAKAGKEKKAKTAVRTEEGPDEKKLPVRMVVRIFTLCLSIMAFVLIVTFVVPSVWSLADARNAFYKQDYEKTYREMVGRQLSDSDQRLFEKTEMILQLSHKYDAYERYTEMQMPVKALDSLLSGYMLWQQLEEKIEEYDAVKETDAVKSQILEALQTDYQLTEEEAQTINGYDAYHYTLELEKITGSSCQQKPGAHDKNAEETRGGTDAVGEAGKEANVQENVTGEATEETTTPTEDVLAEEEIK